MASDDDSTALVLESRSIAKIANREQYTEAAGIRGRIRAAIKYFTDLYEPRLAEQRQHLTNLRADRDKFLDPLNGAQKRLGDLLSAYDDEQYRLKLEREAAEKRKQADAEAEKHQLAALAKQMGNANLADEILEQPEAPQAVITKDTPTAKETEVFFKDLWGGYEVIDLKLVPMEYHLINDAAVKKVVAALKSATNIPGIKVLPPRKIPVQRGQS